jgi:hypothetical protein
VFASTMFLDTKKCTRWCLVNSLYMGLTPAENYLGVVGGRIFAVVDMACISSAAWRFGGPIAAEKAEVTPEFEIEAYLRPCQ